MKYRLGINGFGRIGRCLVKAASKDKEFKDMVDIVAINDLTDVTTLAHLFKYDSVFGKFDGNIQVKTTLSKFCHGMIMSGPSLAD
jgi:glyceraldehyde-3-phosphate dehydrogenase/erythrose-4-phosphate dehydrogenase